MSGTPFYTAVTCELCGATIDMGSEEFNTETAVLRRWNTRADQQEGGEALTVKELRKLKHGTPIWLIQWHEVYGEYMGTQKIEQGALWGGIVELTAAVTVLGGRERYLDIEQYGTVGHMLAYRTKPTNTADTYDKALRNLSSNKQLGDVYQACSCCGTTQTQGVGERKPPV